MSVFFTADPHYGHRRIITICNRPYTTVEEMDEALIANHNSVVGKRDTVHILGDVTLKHPKQYLSRLNGKKHLYLGNHDDRRANALACYDSVQDVALLKIDGEKIWCSHYAHLAWPEAHYGVWHLFGHSHGRTAPVNVRGRMMDVGVDCWNYTPISFEAVREKMYEIMLPAFNAPAP